MPNGEHPHHILVALFDSETSDRIVDAKVKVRITELGLASEDLTLEPFTVEDAETYGNYYRFDKTGIYTIDINVVRTGASTPIQAKFSYRHH